MSELSVRKEAQYVRVRRAQFTIRQLLLLIAVSALLLAGTLEAAKRFNEPIPYFEDLQPSRVSQLLLEAERESEPGLEVVKSQRTLNIETPSRCKQ